MRGNISPRREDEAVALSQELVDSIGELLATQSKVLQVGCPTGYEPVAIALAERFELTLMDSCPDDLARTVELLTRKGRKADRLNEDPCAPGIAGFDLVLHMGGPPGEAPDATLVQGMISRSRRFVLWVDSNPRCFWRWLLAADQATSGQQHTLLVDPAASLAGHNVRVVGLRYMGQALAEGYVSEAVSNDGKLGAEILGLQRCAQLPAEHKAWLVAVLGSVSANPQEVPPEWAEHVSERQRIANLEAALADVRARSAETLGRAEVLRQRALDGFVCYSDRFHQQFGMLRRERAWQVMLAIRKAYTLWFRRGRVGKLRFIKFPFDFLMGRGRQDELEPELPDIWNYVPEDIEVPIRAGQAGVAESRNSGRPYDVVILPVFDYPFRFQRPQQIATQYARRGHRVFWISPNHMLRASVKAQYQTVSLRANLWEIRMRASTFDLYASSPANGNVARMQECLHQLYRDQTISDSVVIVQFPSWRRVATGLRESFGARIVYDCMDDWRNWKTEPLIGQFAIDEEQRLERECDVLVASSAELRRRHQMAGREAVLIRNGADFPYFHSATVNSLLHDVPGPIIGYYGAITTWFDLELVAEAARLRPQYSFVLIGAAEHPEIAKLKALPNVRLLGEKPYRTIAAYLRCFDVCLIPFLLEPVTQAVDPVKLYEYFSQGKPVVATRMEELAAHGELLYLADGPDDFARKLDAAVHESDEQMTQRRIRFASENTWERRVEQLDEALRRTFTTQAQRSEEHHRPAVTAV